MNASPLLRMLSSLFYWLFPAGVVVGLIALVLVLFGLRRFALFLGIVSLLLLAEPFVFLAHMLIPGFLRFDSESWAWFSAWLLYAILPLILPVSAILLARRKEHAQA